MISIDFSDGKIKGKKWEGIRDSIYSLISQMRSCDFVAVNISGQLYTGVEKP